MNDVIRVTKDERVTQTDSGVFGGNTNATAGTGLCHTDGGASSERRPPSCTGVVRANSKAARALLRVDGRAERRHRKRGESMSTESAGKRVSARVSDDDLLDALDDAADEHGSRSEAIRAALRETYADRDSNEANVAAYLPDDPVVRRGYEVLCEEASPFQSRIDVDTAMSRVANRLNIPKGSVKRRVILPLERQRVGGKQIVEPKWGVLVVQQPAELADLAGTVRTDGGKPDA